MNARAATAIVMGMVLVVDPLVAQTPGYSLRPFTLDPAIPPIDAVIGRQIEGQGVNPFRYDCVANLEVVDSTGTVLELEEVEPTQVRVLLNGERRTSETPSYVNVFQSSLLVVLVPATHEVERIAVHLSGARRRGSEVELPDLTSPVIDVPEEANTRCGGTPRTNVDFLNPTGDEAGMGLGVDVVRRIPIAQGRGGLWEFSLEGDVGTSDPASSLDSWKASTHFDLKLNGGFDHWISLGGMGRLEADQDLETVDRVIGATLQVRLDFLGIDAVLRPFLSRFTPYPTLVVQYHNVDRIEESDSPGLPEVPHRMVAGIEWQVPLILDTTVRIELEGTVLLGDVPAAYGGRWQSLSDISIEYPLNASRDVVAVVTRLDGETAPSFDGVARFLIGLGIRR